jgi:glutathione S-transferase
MADYQKFAKLPIIPLVVTPDQEGIQDSTPIIERLEHEHPEPAVHPPDPTARFVSALLEEFGDEWGNKWMFHYRWARPTDQDACAIRIARSMMPEADDDTAAATAAGIKDRMLGRVWFVGSNAVTGPQIERSFREALPRLDAHLAERPYLFGGRPAFGDFGLWGQIYNAWTDPTCGALVEARAPSLLAWIQRMLWPRVEGEFEPWADLSPTLTPFLAEQVGGRFLPWTVANAAAIASGAESFEVELAGETWTQKPQKYHAKSLAALRARYAALGDEASLASLLDQTGCLDGLRG